MVDAFCPPHHADDITMILTLRMEDKRVFVAFRDDVAVMRRGRRSDDDASRSRIELCRVTDVIKFDDRPRPASPWATGIELEPAGRRIGQQGGPHKTGNRYVLSPDTVGLLEVDSLTASQDTDFVPAQPPG
jgi:hypothetical protein